MVGTTWRSNPEDGRLKERGGHDRVGIMGSAMASNPMKAGFRVVGHVAGTESACCAPACRGHRRAVELRRRAPRADRRHFAAVRRLRSRRAVEEIARARPRDRVVGKTSTLPLDVVEHAAQRAPRAGPARHDAPLPAQPVYVTTCPANVLLQMMISRSGADFYSRRYSTITDRDGIKTAGYEILIDKVIEGPVNPSPSAVSIRRPVCHSHHLPGDRCQADAFAISGFGKPYY